MAASQGREAFDKGWTVDTRVWPVIWIAMHDEEEHQAGTLGGRALPCVARAGPT